MGSALIESLVWLPLGRAIGLPTAREFAGTLLAALAHALTVDIGTALPLGRSKGGLTASGFAVALRTARLAVRVGASLTLCGS
ncbi:hypothetical protein D779_0190 [Imhoffiella purpurea]|uniref:Uncharacterized protein n=1 Tax=Imhoffiella purpurea TaxID=1249627 RepID=W9VA35_9GAMM|nr:hypothetical protein D779_0190 [Imhoffiella purpurea]